MYQSIICKKFPALILVLSISPVSLWAQHNQPLFTLLKSETTGITFANTLVDTKEHNILIYSNYYGGAGVGVGDFDNDGLQDIFFAGNLVDDRLYRNLGNMKFEEVTEKAGITEHDGWSSGVVIADVNNDGWTYTSPGNYMTTNQNAEETSPTLISIEKCSIEMAVSIKISPNRIRDNVKCMALLQSKKGSRIIFGVNDGPMQIFEVGNEGLIDY